MAISEIIAAIEGAIIAIGIIRSARKRRRRKDMAPLFPKEMTWGFSKAYDIEKAAIDYHRNVN